MKKKYAILMVFFAATAPYTVQAEDKIGLPDPASIVVPDVTPSNDPKVREEGYKFYYFHNAKVSYTEAHQDLTECRAYLRIGGGTQVPGFIPFGENYSRPVYRGAPMFPGLFSSVMASIIVPKMQRGVESNKMRRCMGTRGYDRFAISEDVWDKLNNGDEAQLLLMQAKLASGPNAKDEVVTR
jgi:hypothetical protein